MREFLVQMVNSQVNSAGILAIVIAILAHQRRWADVRKVGTVLAIVFMANVLGNAMLYRIDDAHTVAVASEEEIIEMDETAKEDPILDGIKVLPNDDPGPGDMYGDPDPGDIWSDSKPVPINHRDPIPGSTRNVYVPTASNGGNGGSDTVPQIAPEPHNVTERGDDTDAVDAIEVSDVMETIDKNPIGPMPIIPHDPYPEQYDTGSARVEDQTVQSTNCIEDASNVPTSWYGPTEP